MTHWEMSLFLAAVDGQKKKNLYQVFFVLGTVSYIPQQQQEQLCYETYKVNACMFITKLCTTVSMLHNTNVPCNLLPAVLL